MLTYEWKLKLIMASVAVIETLLVAAPFVLIGLALRRPWKRHKQIAAQLHREQ